MLYSLSIKPNYFYRDICNDLIEFLIKFQFRNCKIFSPNKNKNYLFMNFDY